MAFCLFLTCMSVTRTCVIALRVCAPDCIMSVLVGLLSFFSLCIFTFLHVYFEYDVMIIIIMRTFRRRHRRKIRAQAWSLFARLFNTNTQKLQYSTSKQFLIKYTSTSNSLNFGTIIINYFLIRPEFIQSGFKRVSRFCVHNVIRHTVVFHILTLFY